MRDDSLNQSIEKHLNGNARHMQMMIQTLLGGLTFNSNESVASFIFILMFSFGMHDIRLFSS
jgi:hypothetical protein